jgi:hypothetical protein
MAVAQRIRAPVTVRAARRLHCYRIGGEVVAVAVRAARRHLDDDGVAGLNAGVRRGKRHHSLGPDQPHEQGGERGPRIVLQAGYCRRRTTSLLRLLYLRYIRLEVAL